MKSFLSEARDIPDFKRSQTPCAPCFYKSGDVFSKRRFLYPFLTFFFRYTYTSHAHDIDRPQGNAERWLLEVFSILGVFRPHFVFIMCLREGLRPSV